MKIFCDQFLSAFHHCQEGKRKPADLPRFVPFPLLHADPTPPKARFGWALLERIIYIDGATSQWYFHGIFSCFQVRTSQGQRFVSASLAFELCRTWATNGTACESIEPVPEMC